MDDTYITRFPSGDGRWPVSVNGGNDPRWVNDEIFFLKGNTLMVVEVDTNPLPPVIGQPKPLFSTEGSELLLEGAGTWNGAGYDVTSDGRRFVIVQRVRSVEEEQEEGTPTITVVQNWAQELEGEK
jgi:hypothetical protein